MRQLLIISAVGLAFTTSAARADTPANIHAFIVQWDVDEDGGLSFAEFKRMTRTAEWVERLTIPTKLSTDLFERYDLNADGFVTAAEMQTINRRAEDEKARMHSANRKE